MGRREPQVRTATDPNQADELIYRAIQEHRRIHGCWPTVGELASAAGVQPQTVRFRLARLVRADWLRPVSRKRGSVYVPTAVFTKRCPTCGGAGHL